MYHENTTQATLGYTIESCGIETVDDFARSVKNPDSLFGSFFISVGLVLPLYALLLTLLVVAVLFAMQVISIVVFMVLGASGSTGTIAAIFFWIFYILYYLVSILIDPFLDTLTQFFSSSSSLNWLNYTIFFAVGSVVSIVLDILLKSTIHSTILQKYHNTLIKGLDKIAVTLERIIFSILRKLIPGIS